MPKVTSENYKEVLLPEIFKDVSESFSELKLIWGTFRGLTGVEDDEWLGKVATQLSSLGERLKSQETCIKVWICVFVQVRFQEEHKKDKYYLSEGLNEKLSGIIGQMTNELYDCFVNQEVLDDFDDLVYKYTGKEWIGAKTQEKCSA